MSALLPSKEMRTLVEAARRAISEHGAPLQEKIMAYSTGPMPHWTSDVAMGQSALSASILNGVGENIPRHLLNEPNVLQRFASKLQFTVAEWAYSLFDEGQGRVNILAAVIGREIAEGDSVWNDFSVEMFADIKTAYTPEYVASCVWSHYFAQQPTEIFHSAELHPLRPLQTIA
ncbi:hypothetical protein MIND_01088000 [Mycena indigotica]|uniref:Uncharacterized protein n=1 Tax=Mycena indigotica TaxID=2126181 RepID=A0A8H6SBW2_9AGAR|nr:uncharacterized protein MIND_01088000 [Mycena indigotica]KAF7295482.1 hypothetical protein MIND_01088000 [Mycena indigotica]